MGLRAGLLIRHWLGLQICCCRAAGLSVAQLQLGPNIRVTEWCPQNDVLAHASTGLFITQAGLHASSDHLLCNIHALRLMCTAMQGGINSLCALLACCGLA